MALSIYLANKLLDHSLGTTTFTKPAAVYLAAHTANPTDTGSGAEVATAGGTLYARIATTFDPASGKTTDLVADALFSTAGANWGTVTHVAIWDNATAGAGNMLHFGALTASKQIDTGDTLRILQADLDVALA